MLPYAIYHYLLENTDRETIASITTAIKSFIKKVGEFTTNLNNKSSNSKTVDDFIDLITSLNIDGMIVRLRLLPKTTGGIGGEYTPHNKTITIYNNELFDNIVSLVNLIKNNDDTSEIKKRAHMFMTSIYNSRGEIAHELVHFMDDNKIRDKNYNNKTIGNLLTTHNQKQIPATNKTDEYINSTWEVNAKLLEHIFKNFKINSLDDFFRALNKNIDSIVWLSTLTPKNKRRVMSRLYQYYVS